MLILPALVAITLSAAAVDLAAAPAGPGRACLSRSFICAEVAEQRLAGVTVPPRGRGENGTPIPRMPRPSGLNEVMPRSDRATHP